MKESFSIMSFAKTTVITLALLSACGPSLTPEQRAVREENLAKNEAIWAQRKPLSVQGNRYEVGIAPDQSYALVAPIGKETFSLAEVETAAKTASGCAGKGDSFLYLLGAEASSRIPVSSLDSLSGRTRVELTC